MQSDGVCFSGRQFAFYRSDFISRLYDGVRIERNAVDTATHEKTGEFGLATRRLTTNAHFTACSVSSLDNLFNQ